MRCVCKAKWRSWRGSFASLLLYDMLYFTFLQIIFLRWHAPRLFAALAPSLMHPVRRKWFRPPPTQGVAGLAARYPRRYADSVPDAHCCCRAVSFRAELHQAGISSFPLLSKNSAGEGMAEY